MQTDKFCHFMYITEAFDYFASFIGHSFESWNWHSFYKFLKFMVKFCPISAPEHRTTKRKFWMIWWSIYYIWTVEIPRFRQFFAILPTKKNKKTKTILPPWLEKERVSLAGAARAPVQGDAQDGGTHAAGLGLHGAAPGETGWISRPPKSFHDSSPQLAVGAATVWPTPPTP